MSLKDKLTAQLGDRMRDSMGAAPAGAGEDAADPAGPPGTTVPQTQGKHTGLKALRAAAMISLDRLVPDPDQPRKTFSDEEIDRLADSLRARGMLQPIRARWDPDLDRWIIIAGERRYRAARRVGWMEVPCVTVDGSLTASEIRMDQIIENCLREDLPPLEQAAAFKALMDANEWSARRLAEELHLSHQSVLRALGLLDLPEPVRRQVAEGKLAPRTAAEIATLERPEDQIALAEQAATEGLTRDQVVATVQARKVGQEAPARPTSTEIRLDDGHKIRVTGPAVGVGPMALVEVLRRAIKRLQNEARANSEGKGEAA